MANETLNVILRLVTGDYKREAREAATATGQIGVAAQGTTRPVGLLQGAIGKLGGVMAGVFVGGAIVNFARDSIMAASDLEESINAVRVVFGDAAGAIEEFGETSVDAVGLAAVNVNKSATVLGASLINTGFAADEAAAKTIELTTRAADMASVFNTEVPVALEAIQSALRGQSNPIEQFGVTLTAAAVDAEAAALGYKKVAGEFDATAKTAARLSIIMKQTDVIAGDFQNTSDSTANTMKKLRERFTEMQGRIGTALLPAFKALLDVADKLAPAFEDIATEIANTVSEIKPLLEGLGTIVGWYSDMKGAIKDATESENDFVAGLAGIVDVLSGSGIGAIGKGFAFWDRITVEGKDAAKSSKDAVTEIHDSWMGLAGQDSGPAFARDIIAGDGGLTDAFIAARDRALDMRDANREAARSFRKDLTDAISGFVTFFEGAVEEIDASLAELEKQWKERSTQNERFWNGLAVLARAGLDDLVAELQTQGPAAASTVEDLVADMDRAFDWERRIEEQKRQAAAMANALANGLEGELDAVGAAFERFGISLADALEAGFSTADLGNTLAQLMDLADQAGITTPSGPGADKRNFATGGVVPGPMGSPQLIMAHAGEVVLTRAQAARIPSFATGGVVGGGSWSSQMVLANNQMLMPVMSMSGGNSYSNTYVVQSPMKDFRTDLQYLTILSTVTNLVETQS